MDKAMTQAAHRSEAKSERFAIRTTPSERELIVQAAKSSGKKVTAFLRDAGLVEAHRALRKEEEIELFSENREQNRMSKCTTGTEHVLGIRTIDAHEDDNEYTVHSYCVECDEEFYTPDAHRAGVAQIMGFTEAEVAERSFGWCPHDGGHWSPARFTPPIHA